MVTTERCEVGRGRLEGPGFVVRQLCLDRRILLLVWIIYKRVRECVCVRAHVSFGSK